MPLLAAEADVIAPDLPQHGFSRAPAGGRQSMPAMAWALGALLAALDARPALIVGHSAGAAVALRMVLDGHAAPGAVIGFNAALAPFRGLAGLLFPPTAKFLALNPASPWVFSSVVGGRQQARRLIEGTGSTIDRRGLDCYRALFGRSDHVSGALTMMANWDLRPLRADLWRLETPTLLVVGLGDRAVPPDEARRLAAAHEEIRYAEAAGAGHLLHEERPGEAAATILDVLRGREVGEVPGAG
jgi:magnesium chelatase accessory protein